jgi:hypothetical protein
METCVDGRLRSHDGLIGHGIGAAGKRLIRQ